MPKKFTKLRSRGVDSDMTVAEKPSSMLMVSVYQSKGDVYSLRNKMGNNLLRLVFFSCFVLLNSTVWCSFCTFTTTQIIFD